MGCSKFSLWFKEPRLSWPNLVGSVGVGSFVLLLPSWDWLPTERLSVVGDGGLLRPRLTEECLGVLSFEGNKLPVGIRRNTITYTLMTLYTRV